MYIEDIRIEPARTTSGYILTIESGGWTFTGHFGPDLNLFFGVCSSALKYFGTKHGLIRPTEDGNFKAGPRSEKG